MNRIRLSRAIRFRMGLQHTKWDETRLRYLKELVGYDTVRDADEAAIICDEVAECTGVLYQETMSRWINLWSPEKHSIAYHLRNI